MVGGQPALAQLRSIPQLTWPVRAIGPNWRPPPTEPELQPVPGVLRVHPEGLVFRADDAVDRTTGQPLAAMIPADTVLDAGPLTPGTRLVSSEPAGSWMPRWQRRWRIPGFAIRTTTDGGWGFETPRGASRSSLVNRIYLGKRQ